ncbi:redoxin domain-containing protein [bacterium]|nr:redoxin domain-containing protein [bacterium]
MSKLLQAGDKAPDFSMPKGDGSIVKLIEYAGRMLVIFFYPKDDTAGCTREAIEFSTKLPNFSERGVSILGVSRDSPKSHDAFRRKHGLTVDLASDETGEVCESYGVWVSKSMYGRTFMGIERSTFLVGPDGVIQTVWRKVRVPGHVDAVLDECS